MVYLNAQPVLPKVNIQAIGPDQGLPERAVRRITQDKLGYLWIGTHAALWRYNGYSFYNYANLLIQGSDTVTSIDDLTVVGINKIWGAHSKGVTVFNRSICKTLPLTRAFTSGKINFAARYAFSSIAT